MYNVEYLPVARKDLLEIAEYVQLKLANPTAAWHLIQQIVEAVEALQTFPYSFPVYYPLRPCEHEFRKLAAKNHLVFYWVDEAQKAIVVARILYAKRDYDMLLNDPILRS